jgi:hypothetical protein
MYVDVFAGLALLNLRQQPVAALSPAMAGLRQLFEFLVDHQVVT